MNIQIHSVRFDADKKLTDFVRQRVEKLVNFGEDIVKAEVYLRIDKDQGGENKISEIKLDVAGKPLFVKKQSKTFEEATDDAIDALKKQIAKNKQKKDVSGKLLFAKKQSKSFEEATDNTIGAL
jgi:putative sigma-54 modulation protein